MATGAELEAQFQEAADRARTTTNVRLGDTQRLELYGLYKQATEGDNHTTAPGLLNFTGRAKWTAWKSHEGMTPTQARHCYIHLVHQLFSGQGGEGGGGAAPPPTGGSSSSSGGDSGLGIRVSTMGAIPFGDGSCGEEAEKIDAFYHAKNGDKTKVLDMVNTGEIDIDAQDDEGRSVLHWAVDGGHTELAQALLDRGANPQLKDSEGDTPLDYAQNCDYEDLVKILSASQRHHQTNTG